MFKGLANLASLMKDFQQIQGRTAEMQEALGRVRVEGSAGGEMVVVKANGLQQISEIKIDRSLLENPDAEMLEDLLVSATNQALDKAREATSAEMAKLTSNLQLPGLSEMMSKFGLGQGPDGEHA
jgi:DNA-binding YbaB/EbfC family protein